MMDDARFFSAVRLSLFGGRLSPAQVTGMSGILEAFDQAGDGRAKTLGYAFATAFHETGQRMVPVREGFAATDARARQIVASRRYGKPVPPYGHVYYGRGHVQLTWGDNYKASSADAGVDLFANPDQALDPIISARLLTIGLLDGRWNGRGKGIAFYLPDDGPDDLQGARRTVNITDKWELIAGYHRKFMAAIDGAGFAAAARPLPRPVTPETPPAEAEDPAEIARLQDLVQWRADAPAAALTAATDWIRRMPA